MGYQLGIDFGTSTTKVALRGDDGVPVALPIGRGGEPYMPSVVAYKRLADGVIDVSAIGEDAAAMAERDDVKVVREVKRYIARRGTSGLPDEPQYSWWNDSDGYVHLWSARINPQDVVLTILEEALRRAVRVAASIYPGKVIDGTTIRGFPMRMGCPASANLEMRTVLTRVAKCLGYSVFQVRNLSEEPILASLPYADIEWDQGNRDQLVLVYDWGGGSFDTAVVHVHRKAGSAPELTVLAVDGEAFCGGADIDEAFFLYLLERLVVESLGFDKSEVPLVLGQISAEDKLQLKDAGRRAKEILSGKEATDVAVPPGSISGSSLKITVTRQELEEVVRSSGVIQKTLSCVLRCWMRARMIYRVEGETPGGYFLKHDAQRNTVSKPVLGLRYDDMAGKLGSVLLVGGVTKMPYVRKILASHFGQERLSSESVVRPIESVAVGAAWQEEDTKGVVDRLPFSVFLSSNGAEEELYGAYEPTVCYRTFADSPRIVYYGKLGTIPVSGDHAIVVLREPDDGESRKTEIPAQRGKLCKLEIDCWNRLLVTSGSDKPVEVPNPAQHPVQRETIGHHEELQREIQFQRQKQEREEWLRQSRLRTD